MSRPTRVLLAAALAFAAGCGGGGPGAAAGPLRVPGSPLPQAQPDVLLVTVSGRTTDLGQPFCPPACNVAYLGRAGGAAEAIFNDLVNRGYLVGRADYIASLRSFDDDGDGFADRFGCLQLIDDLAFVLANWIDGAAAPTRILVVGHSHGAVWGHIAASVVPAVPIEVLVSLDGTCLQWEEDHAASITAYYGTEGGNPFPWDIARPCAAWTIPGFASPFDTHDVAFANVGLNLEVQSDGSTAGVQDTVDNVRPDGTAAGIRTVAGLDSHTQVDEPGTASMQWVLTELALVFD